MAYIDELRSRVQQAEERLEGAVERAGGNQEKLSYDDLSRYSAELSGLLHSLLNAVEEHFERKQQPQPRRRAA